MIFTFVDIQEETEHDNTYVPMYTLCLLTRASKKHSHEQE